MIDVEVSVRPSTADEARIRADRIRSGMRVLADWQRDVVTAYSARDWDSLGYGSWEAYLDGEFGEHRVRLPRDQRREIVASMTSAEMSTRAIASAIGVDQKTVVNDLRRVEENSSTRTPTPHLEAVRDYYDTHDTAGDMDGGHWEEDEPVASVQRAFDQGEKGVTSPPPRVTGTDGKSYSTQTRTQNRPQLPAQFLSAANDLTKVIARVEKLRSDDRYRSNRGAIADRCIPSIRRATEVLSDLMDDLGEDDGDST